MAKPKNPALAHLYDENGKYIRQTDHKHATEWSPMRRMSKKDKQDLVDNIVSDLVTGALNGKEIAEKYSVSLMFVSSCKSNISRDVLDKMSAERADTISDLILAHMQVSLEAAIRITEQTKDEEWMKAQNAADLTKFYATMTDKVVRMAEAIEFTSQQRELNDPLEADRITG